MQFTIYILSFIWRTWFFINFCLFFILLSPFYFYFTKISPSVKWISQVNKLVSRLTLSLSGIFIKVNNKNLNTNLNTYILCPNHSSYLDIAIISLAVNGPIIFMGKVELTKIPIFGYFFKRNSVIVNRSNRKSAYAALVKAGEKIDLGHSMCIFPEGGIPKKDISLASFKNGPFKLAVDKKVRIVPVTIFGSKKIFPQKYYKGGPGIIDVTIHKHISPILNDKNNPENLKNLIYNIIFTQLKNYENK